MIHATCYMLYDKPEYDVIIVGGGIVGAALLYTLAKDTAISRIALIEKRSRVGAQNSHAKNNSQTLHFGDIETHYTLEKAIEVQRAANLLKNFLLKHDPDKKLHQVFPKMVLAVGQKEVDELRTRFTLLKDQFPNISLLERAEIAMVEPNVVKGRSADEPILALASTDGYVVNFGLVAEEFVRLAKQVSNKTVDVFLDTEVKNISFNEVLQKHQLVTSRGTFQSSVVEVTSGGYSLWFARQFGLGTNWTLANIIGNFYATKNVLNGKVYRMQIPGLPFGTVHGDPDVRDASLTRFGPTAKAVFLLDRERLGSLRDYFSLLGISWRTYRALLSVVKEKIVVKYMAMNVVYDLPFIGKRLFVRELQKIVPSLTYRDIQRLKNEGGVRPQIIDIAKRQPILGEGKLYGHKIIFNITPSPGASVSLGSAEADMKRILEMLK